MTDFSDDFSLSHNYYRPDVRNLAWVLASPALLSFLPEFNQPLTVFDNTFWQQQYAAYRPRLQALDADSEPLLTFLAQHKNHRLGYYFEYLLLFWLLDRDYHPFELIQHRATLFQGKITIGELDFLIRNHQTGKIEHWEVAIKFYLGHPPLDDAWRWLGPNDRDSLGRKLKHLAEQQFRFTSWQDDQIEQRGLVMKGRLFYPGSHKTLLQRASGEGLPCLAPQHLQGNWLLWPDFVENVEAAQLQWRHVSRDEWLANQQINKRLPLALASQLPPLPTARPELFLGFDDHGQEQARCFVCPEARQDLLHLPFLHDR